MLICIGVDKRHELASNHRLMTSAAGSIQILSNWIVVSLTTQKHKD